MYEGLAIKLSERESLLKSFTLFFLIIEIFLIFIFYNYYHIEKEHIKKELILEMKNYSIFFDDERFDIDIVSLKKNTQLFYELYSNKNNIYILIPMQESRKDALKVIYPIKTYTKHLHAMKISLLRQFFLLSIIALLISILFSFYVLQPLRQALKLLEVFIKDIIHDLNTPLTSILISLKMMDKNCNGIETISSSAKTISMLHQNLDIYLRESTFENEKFYLKEVVDEQVAFFSSIYDYLDWHIDIENPLIKSDKTAFSRIIYNLLSNASKYNTSHGFIEIKMEKNILSITNDSYNGIKNPSKVFERFYKENERGIGIGLHIVEKLSKELGIEKEIKIKNNIVSIHLNLKKLIVI